jgi:hypothetical protein
MFSMATKLLTENRLLAETRDLLLNRLISGKLRVDDLHIAFPPSMAESVEQPAALAEESPECAIRRLRGEMHWEGDLDAMREAE